MPVTTTFELQHVNTAEPIDLTVFHPINPSEYVLLGGPPAADDKREAVYQKTTGSKEYPASIRLGYYLNRKANSNTGQVNTSVKNTTYVTKLVDGVEVWTLPATCTIALSMPGTAGTPDPEDLIALLMNTLSCLIPVTLGVAKPDALNELGYGVVTNMLGHESTASA